MKSWPIVQVRRTSDGCRVCFASSLSMLWSQQRRSVPCHGPYGALVQCQLSECKQIESILWQHLYHSFRNEGCKICCSSRMWPGINIRQSEPDRTPQSRWGNCVGWVLRNHQYYVSLPGGYGVSVETSSCSEGTISVWNCCFHPEEVATSSDFSPSLNCNAMQHLQAWKLKNHSIAALSSLFMLSGAFSLFTSFRRRLLGDETEWTTWRKPAVPRSSLCILCISWQTFGHEHNSARCSQWS
jgi:hypothetical protein